uniref:Chitin-binding type-2 domain-containing protein n=1 Tax=Timema cristinae TaxID=61476 RepID=A0A7R9H2S5_TIMCR|nr:unnamed protein product [Timema cristinae]
MKLQPISSCLFLYLTLLCEAIYFPGDEVTKPPKRREKLPWYQHHRYPDNTVTSVPTQLDRQGSVLSSNRPLTVDSNIPRSQGRWMDSPGNELEEETPPGLEEDTDGSGMGTEVETLFSAVVRTVPATILSPTLSSSQDSVTSQLGPEECPPGATGQFTYPPDCGRFLNCWKGRGFVQPCAPATLFNPDTLECDFPAKVKCVESTIEEWQTFYTPSTPLVLGLPSRCQLSLVPNLPSRCQLHLVLGLPSRCQLSLVLSLPSRCQLSLVLGLPSRCQLPLVLDLPSRCQLCLVTVYKVGASLSTRSKPEAHREGKHLSDSTTAAPPLVIKSDCPMEGGTGLASHPTDCSKYLNCWNGEAHIQSCGPGTLFNPVTLLCDHPYNVECGEHKALQGDHENITTPEKPRQNTVI